VTVTCPFSLEDVYSALALLKAEGVENYSIDLMSGLPNQVSGWRLALRMARVSRRVRAGNKTMAQWDASLKEVVASGAAHVSVYDLQVEAGTVGAPSRNLSPGWGGLIGVGAAQAFGRWYTAGASPLPPDETSAEMYARASEFLRAHDYEHYEISNYARPGERHVTSRALNLLEYLNLVLGQQDSSASITESTG
jgi:coproporphyrinogen III oxidase-like Fe-S oxidoreductase